DPLRALRHGRDLGDRDGGGVGGEDGVVPHDLVERAEDVVLDFQLLEDGLDDDVGVGAGVQVGGRGDAGEGGVGVVRLHPALADELVVRPLDAVGAPRERFVGDVAQDDLPARLSGDLGDAGPHETGPDDGELACHCATPLRNAHTLFLYVTG